MSDTPRPDGPSQSRKQKTVIESEGLVFRNAASTGAPSDTTPRPTSNTPYEVGFGKPPTNTRFKKGKSGNPLGRQKNRKTRPYIFADAVTDGLLQQELYRPITITQNGKKVEMSAMQIAIRAQVNRAMRGERLSFQKMLELAEDREEEYLEASFKRYTRLERAKRDGEAVLADCKKREVNPPQLLPHPHDITLNPMTWEAKVNGPETLSQAAHWEYFGRLREYLYRYAFYTQGSSGIVREENGQKLLHVGFFLANYLNGHVLPKSYRWDEWNLIAINLDDRATQEDWHKMMTEKKAWLDENCCIKNSDLPLDIQEKLRTALHSGISNAWVRTGIPADGQHAPRTTAIKN